VGKHGLPEYRRRAGFGLEVDAGEWDVWAGEWDVDLKTTVIPRRTVCAVLCKNFTNACTVRVA